MAKIWLIITLTSGLLVGCAESNSDNEVGTTTPDAVSEESTSAPAEITEEAILSVGTANANQNQVNTAAPAVGLNPPHGQPGHDCDIAVGAPLDGSGGQPQPAVQPTFNPQVAQPAAQGTAPADGLNPPHGQPGHDCAVAVGAPLPAK